MTIEELHKKHKYIQKGELSEVGWHDIAHRNLSIEYTISVLEELHAKNVSYFYFVDAKIQELKQYLEK